jgi:hypothetical protein
MRRMEEDMKGSGRFGGWGATALGPAALVLAALVLAALWLMGLGGGSNGSSGPDIPIPQENFTVTVSDATGQKLEARRFTWEGKVYLRGQVGNATVSLPFSKIRSVRVERDGKAASLEAARASVTLKTGDTVEVMVERSSKCYGETKFGNYEIFFKDIAAIEFQ